ncbi:MAG: hypothetical protein LAO06_02210 [Acidobacteriia bacterium]|nr:hypothetical protein [Terriglobia bacterium]
MTGAKRQSARAIASLIVLALCWPMATAFAAAASAPAQKACCMRASHGCHEHDQSGNQSGDQFESICHACGWCHALPNAPAHLASASVTFSFSVYLAAGPADSQSQPAPAPSRLHSSRAPPRTAET